MSDVKIEINVEVEPGAPVASVSTTEMTAVEGHTVTIGCQASGKLPIYLCCTNALGSAPPFFLLMYHHMSSLSSPFQVPLRLSSPGLSFVHRYLGSTRWSVVF